MRTRAMCMVLPAYTKLLFWVGWLFVFVLIYKSCSAVCAER